MPRLNDLRVADGRAEREVEFLGVTWKIRSLTTPAFVQHREKLLKPYQRDLQRGRKTMTELQDIVAPAFARHVLVGWDGLLDENDKPIPYSEAKALDLLTEPEFSHVATFLIEEAQDATAFLAEVREANEGN